MIINIKLSDKEVNTILESLKFTISECEGEGGCFRTHKGLIKEIENLVEQQKIIEENAITEKLKRYRVRLQYSSTHCNDTVYECIEYTVAESELLATSKVMEKYKSVGFKVKILDIKEVE